MKNIEVEPDLYQFIASQTQHIGENASQILRRLLAPQMEAAQRRMQPEEVAPSTQVTNTQVDSAPVESPKTEAVSEPEKVKKPVKPAAKTAKEEKKEEPSQTVEPSTGSDVLLSKSLIKSLKEKKSKVDVFLLLLGEMNKQKSGSFNQVLDIKGSNRAYFGADKQTLLDSGKSTNPKQIPGSSYWVVTNNNTQRKSDLLCKVALRLGYADAEVEKLGSIL